MIGLPALSTEEVDSKGPGSCSQEEAQEEDQEESMSWLLIDAGSGHVKV